LWHIARGWATRWWAEVSTASASIHWIRPGYTYLDESSRVVVYCLKGHNMLGWCEYMKMWKYIWLIGWNLLCSSLPYFCCVCSAVWYSLLRWSSTCWCEQMRGTPVGNREVIVPLHNLHGLDLSFFGLSLGSWPMYCFLLITLLHLLDFSIVLCWHRGVPSL